MLVYFYVLGKESEWSVELKHPPVDGAGDGVTGLDGMSLLQINSSVVPSNNTLPTPPLRNLLNSSPRPLPPGYVLSSTVGPDAHVQCEENILVGGLSSVGLEESKGEEEEIPPSATSNTLASSGTLASHFLSRIDPSPRINAGLVIRYFPLHD